MQVGVALYENIFTRTLNYSPCASYMCACNMADNWPLQRDCSIRGYHVYQSVWHAAVGEMTNHLLPRKVSRVCSIFLRREGCISCLVHGRRRYSEDLPQGGLEIPCRLDMFEGEVKETK